MLQKSRTPSILIRKNSLRWSASIFCLAAASFGLSVPANAAPTYTVLYSFAGKPNDGDGGGGSLVRDTAGNLYGTTSAGGPYDMGTAFKLDSAGNETVLTEFDYGNGEVPNAGLLRHQGSLYDTTLGGGYYGGGAVIKVSDRGKVTLLYNFCSLANCTDGYAPYYWGVTRDSAGNLYGSTQVGGAYNWGTVFKLDPTGNETVLYSFCPNGGTCSDGMVPEGVVRDSTGNLYGGSNGGGNSNCGCGVIWKLDTSGNESVLHAFAGPPSDGFSPTGQLVIDGTGNLYGVTNVGGSGACQPHGCGTVFKIDVNGNETILHNFTGEDGAFPGTQAIIDKKGNLYGATGNGGGTGCGGVGCGTVFKLSTSGKLKVLYSFQGQSDGAGPQALLLEQGVLYGETLAGGDLNCSEGGGYGCGVVFKITNP